VKDALMLDVIRYFGDVGSPHKMLILRDKTYHTVGAKSATATDVIPLATLLENNIKKVWFDDIDIVNKSFKGVDDAKYELCCKFAIQHIANMIAINSRRGSGNQYIRVSDGYVLFYQGIGPDSIDTPIVDLDNDQWAYLDDRITDIPFWNYFIHIIGDHDDIEAGLKNIER